MSLLKQNQGGGGDITHGIHINYHMPQGAKGISTGHGYVVILYPHKPIWCISIVSIRGTLTLALPPPFPAPVPCAEPFH